MAAHPGVLYGDLTAQITSPLLLQGTSANAYAANDDQWVASGGWEPGGLVLALGDGISGPSTAVAATPVSEASPGVVLGAIGDDWWEKFHVLPRKIALGNLLSTTDVEVDLFNADRYASRSWTGFQNNPGTGTELLSLSLPDTFAPLHGDLYTYRITLEGPGTVDSTLDYTFTGQPELRQAISFTRVLVFPFMPEHGIREFLEWHTEVLEHEDGSEQRIAYRDFPRQFFHLRVLRAIGTEKQRLDRLLFDRQTLAWGLMVPTESVRLRVAAAPSDTALLVEETINSDFRAGGSAILWTSETTYETVLVDEVRPTSLQINSGLVGSWAVGTRVMPLRTANLVENSWRRNRGLADYSLSFVVADNEADLALTNWWSTVDGRPLVDDYNFVRGSVPESFDRLVTVIDNGLGRVYQASSQAFSFRSSWKRWVTKSPAETRRVRGLLYALRGEQGTFYLPTFDEDLTPVDDLASGAATMDVANTGYTDYVAQRHPADWIRVVKSDGTTIVRRVTNSSVVSSTIEQLTVDSNWGENVAVEDIARVEFLEEVRLGSNRIEIQHGIPGRATIPAPVRTVVE
jgi:hypothetical protein